MPNVFNVPGVPSLTSYLPGALTLLSANFNVAALAATAGQAILEWGIYRNGQPIILPKTSLTSGLSNFSILNTVATSFIGAPTIFPVVASFVEVEFKQDWPLSDYPIEQGGFQTYDKVRLPYSLRLRLAASGNQADLQAFLTTIQNICEDGSLGNPTALQTFVNQALGTFGINLSGISQAIGSLTGGNNLYDIVTPSRVYTGVSAIHYDVRRTATSGVSMLVVDVWFMEVRITTTATLTSTQFAQFAGAQNIGTVSPQNINFNLPTGAPY